MGGVRYRCRGGVVVLGRAGLCQEAGGVIRVTGVKAPEGWRTPRPGGVFHRPRPSRSGLVCGESRRFPGPYARVAARGELSAPRLAARFAAKRSPVHFQDGFRDQCLPGRQHGRCWCADPNPPARSASFFFEHGPGSGPVNTLGARRVAPARAGAEFIMARGLLSSFLEPHVWFRVASWRKDRPAQPAPLIQPRDVAEY